MKAAESNASRVFRLTSRLAWIALLLVVVVLVLWFSGSRDRASEADSVVRSSSPALASSVLARDPDALERQVDTGENDLEHETDAARAPVRAADAAESRPPYGTLVLNVSDPSPLGPLRSFQLRVGN